MDGWKNIMFKVSVLLYFIQYGRTQDGTERRRAFLQRHQIRRDGTY